jgi:hypothetical protein
MFNDKLIVGTSPSEKEEPKIDIPTPEAQFGISIQKNNEVFNSSSSSSKAKDNPEGRIDLSVTCSIDKPKNDISI